MIRLTCLATAAALMAAPTFAAESKKQSCEYQSQVVAAIQRARIDRVKEREVPAAIAATNPSWPDNYNAAIPLMAPWVYDQKMKVVRNEDMAAAWLELCLQQ